ncbi:DNA cytosine methyltransferase, partial [Escherichia coli]
MVDENSSLTLSKTLPFSIFNKPATFSKIADKISGFKKLYFDKQLWILGGPPCQGFSTAGNARTMDDPRNSLFMHYKSLLNEIKPNGFIFENVAGLL